MSKPSVSLFTLLPTDMMRDDNHKRTTPDATQSRQPRSGQQHFGIFKGTQTRAMSSSCLPTREPPQSQQQQLVHIHTGMIRAFTTTTGDLVTRQPRWFAWHVSSIQQQRRTEPDPSVMHTLEHEEEFGMGFELVGKQRKKEKYEMGTMC